MIEIAVGVAQESDFKIFSGMHDTFSTVDTLLEFFCTADSKCTIEKPILAQGMLC